jgi:digalactosyldiacylglycerol synthase
LSRFSLLGWCVTACVYTTAVNFYRAPGLRGWRQKFSHVIGIVHTNYKAYAQHHYSGLVTGPIVGVMSAWMVRAYCDKVIKLSPVLQEYAVEKECVENVHGIRPEFLSPPLKLTGNKVYFLGKLLWCKGLDKLLELEEEYRRSTGSYFEVDVFGSGPEEAEIQRAFGQSSTSTGADKAKASYAWRRRPLPVTFPGRVDHATIGGEYKVFVNPSVTEVLCTSTAEAIARGRFVLVPQHPSNDFFVQFPNCLQYKSRSDFCALLQLALSHDPVPLTPDQQHALTWEAATDRLIRAAAVSRRDRARRDRVGLHLDERLAKWHYDWGRGKTGDVLRTVLGGGPVAAQTQYSSTSSLVSATSVSTSSSSSSTSSSAA